MDREKTKRYSDEELSIFKKIILNKREKANKSILVLSGLSKNQNGTDDTSRSFEIIEDAKGSLSNEEITLLIEHQNKVIVNSDRALSRIENKTYGICKETGKLISKERLRCQPFATQGIESKMEQQEKSAKDKIEFYSQHNFR